MSIFNVINKRVSSVDPITFLLQSWNRDVIIEFEFDSLILPSQIPIEIVNAIPYISFLLMGVIIALTLRSVLSQVDLICLTNNATNIS